MLSISYLMVSHGGLILLVARIFWRPTLVLFSRPILSKNLLLPWLFHEFCKQFFFLATSQAAWQDVRCMSNPLIQAGKISPGLPKMRHTVEIQSRSYLCSFFGMRKFFYVWVLNILFQMIFVSCLKGKVGFILLNWPVNCLIHCVPGTTVSFQKHTARSKIDRFPKNISLDDP